MTTVTLDNTKAIAEHVIAALSSKSNICEILETEQTAIWERWSGTEWVSLEDSTDLQLNLTRARRAYVGQFALLCGIDLSTGRAPDKRRLNGSMFPELKGGLRCKHGVANDVYSIGWPLHIIALAFTKGITTTFRVGAVDYNVADVVAGLSRVVRHFKSELLASYKSEGGVWEHQQLDLIAHRREDLKVCATMTKLLRNRLYSLVTDEEADLVRLDAIDALQTFVREFHDLLGFTVHAVTADEIYFSTGNAFFGQPTPVEVETYIQNLAANDMLPPLVRYLAINGCVDPHGRCVFLNRHTRITDIKGEIKGNIKRLVK